MSLKRPPTGDIKLQLLPLPHNPYASEATNAPGCIKWKAETKQERMERIAKRLNGNLSSIRRVYNNSRKTPEEQEESAGDGGLLAMQEERYRKGEITLEALNMNRRLVGSVANLMEQAREREARERAAKGPPPKHATWTFEHSTHGRITITDESFRHWRTATVDDMGSIVYCYEGCMCRNLDEPGEFGEFDDVGEEEDEEFPEETHQTAVIYTQTGKLIEPHECSGEFEGVFVVPGEVLLGLKGEAPPGKAFSGISSSSSKWTPAPAGKVWFTHPSSSPTYLDDETYHSAERVLLKLKIGGFVPSGLDVPDEAQIFDESYPFHCWCPVLKRFLNKGEVFRQEHWFHNGDGSAQKRYYYNQLEMLERHGGVSTLPKKAVIQNGNIYLSWRGCDQDEIEVGHAQTASQAINKRFKKAEKEGKVLVLD
jgi:hypothetical protein